MSNRFSGEIPYGNRWLGYFVQHRTAANLLLVLMVLGGVYAGGQIRSQFFPDVVLETITVNVAWPGAGAEDVDNGIVELMAPVLLAVDGVESSAQQRRKTARGSGWNSSLGGTWPRRPTTSSRCRWRDESTGQHRNSYHPQSGVSGPGHRRCDPRSHRRRTARSIRR